MVLHIHGEVNNGNTKTSRPTGYRARPDDVYRIPAYIIEQVDEWATKKGLSRSETIRQFVEQGLAVKPKAKR